MTIDVSTRAPLAAPVRAYAARFHSLAGGRHHVASPLGAWLLLALCAPASTGRLREELASVLGMDVDVAFGHASHLIDRPHPALSAALGAWTAAALGGPELARWLSQLPVQTARGAIPTQAELDAWVERESKGIIARFPVRVDPRLVALLVSVLATKVDWIRPFTTAPASELGPFNRWPALTRVLTATDETGEGETQLIVPTERIGDVAVHHARGRGGVDVISVIADADVAPDAVLDTAYEIATMIANDEPIARRSLYDLPLGDTPRWTIAEAELEAPNGESRPESYRSVLPAWSATSAHELDDPALGFTAAAEVIRQLIGEPGAMLAAKQAVRARYSRTGFEAAAVTFMSFLGSSGPPPRVLMRTATLRFCHPFAAVAIARNGVDYDPEQRTTIWRAWGGLPLFSAWVAEPEDAEVDERSKAR